jgi:ABC-type multidrug transport system ATPase subunit
MANVIETNHLTKVFNSLTAVDKLDITVESGEIFGLLGPNGAEMTASLATLSSVVLSLPVRHMLTALRDCTMSPKLT